MIKLAFIDLGSRLVRYFAEVAKELEPGIQAYFFCTKKKSWSIAKRSGLATYPENFSAMQTREIPQEIKQLILNKKILASSRNERKLTKRIDWLYPSLESFFIRQGMDAVFVWNGSGLTARVSLMLARQLQLKTVFGENGYFHNTLQLDPQGVNQAASITARIAKEYPTLEIQADKLQQLQSVIQAYRQHKAPEYTIARQQIRPALSAVISDELNHLLNTHSFKFKRLNRAVPDTIQSLPQKFIFIPFQVVKDSQLLLYSPLVGNDMGLFLASCHSAVKQVAADYQLVVKLHPEDVNSVDYSAWMERFPDVIFLKEYPSNKLIESSDLVITINSTVGVEALIYGKPVITLGDNFYNVPEVVHHVETLSDLPQTIATALSSPQDEEKTLRLLYYLYHCYFTHGTWKNFSPQSIRAVADKITQLVKRD